MCDVLVIPNAIPESSARTLANLVQALDPVMFNVYNNPFESKLQVPKHMHSYPVVKHVLNILNSNLNLTLLGSHFNIPYLYPDQDTQYHTALFTYRSGDFLKRHYDCAIHRDYRKAITLLLYLSDCEGGDLVINGITIIPRFNTLVAFTNTDDADHEVTEIISGQRIVLTTGLLVQKYEELDNMTRTNTRAQFIAEEGWTPAMYKLSRRGTIMNKDHVLAIICGLLVIATMTLEYFWR